MKSYTLEIKTNRGQQKEKINHCLLSPKLIKYTKCVNRINIGDYLTDHRAIEVCLDWAHATKGRQNFRANLGIEKDINYQFKVKKIQ